MSKGGRGSNPITDCVVTSFGKGHRAELRQALTPPAALAESTLDQTFLLTVGQSLTETVLSYVLTNVEGGEHMALSPGHSLCCAREPS